MILANARVPQGGLADVEIAGGLIVATHAPGRAPPPNDRLDLGGMLLLPAFVDGHLHLDKTHWGAPRLPHVEGQSVRERIAAERIQRHRVGLPIEARASALDLSLVDGRFAPDVLIAEVRRAVQAWTDAVDGSDADLRQLASGAATRDLLHPGDPSEQTRLVLRGPRVRSVEIVAIDPHATPPRITVQLHVSARRYIEDRDTLALLSGNKDREMSFTERWAMVLDRPARREGAELSIALDNAVLRFVAAEDGRGAGLSGVDLAVRDKAGILDRARRRGRPVTADTVDIGGVRFRLRDTDRL